VMETETQLRQAMRTATSASPEPIAFDLISERVRQRRRHAVIAVCAVVAVAATTPVLVKQLGSSGDVGQPSQSGDPVAPTPGLDEYQPLGVDPVLDSAIVQKPWTADRWQQLPWSTTALPPLLDPVAADTTSLAADPVGRALAAVQPYSNRGDRTIYLLGEDGRWRVQDLVDVKPTVDHNGYRDSALGVGSLSTDGAQLALPQPYGLIVIDLTTNTVRRHELPGLPMDVSWDPSGLVLVGSTPDDRYRTINMLVDAESGSWDRVPYNQHLTSYADDGTAVEVHLKGRPTQGSDTYEVRRYDPDRSMEATTLPVDLFEDSKAPVAAGSDTVLVMREVGHWTIPRPAGAWDGPTILDIDSGQALAQLPTPGFQMLIGTHPLGWVNEDTVILRFDDHVVAWDYQTGELRRITEIARGDTVTIAAPLVEADS
jgi:hypothetical protein